MNLRHLVSATALILFCATPVLAQEKTGDLKITFKLKGDAPELGNVDVTTDKPFCGKKDVPDQRLIVNEDSKGIKNVVVYVYTGRRGTELPEQKPRNHKLNLANESCMFEPHVVLAQKGDTIEVTNPDEVGHNTNLGFFNNEAQNFTIPAGQSKTVKLEEAEPAVIPVACNIHPWMLAHVLVVDHPFAGISDENGVLEIKGLPVGDEVVFRAWHEVGTFKNEIYIDGEEEKWSSNKFELEIKPGMNDLGTVEVPVGEFDL
ncbi:MAG: methylamine utilization protein [Pirellulaceae bacterium]|nr:methylamine utilization protein [Pirellulaceae bacterium]